MHTPFVHELSARSPDGRCRITVERRGDTLVYALFRDGRPLLMPAGIGLDIPGLRPDFARAESEPMECDLSADTPFYTKRARIRLKANGFRLDLGRLALTVLATDRGCAFRWETAAVRGITVRNETFALQPAGSPDLLYGHNSEAWHGDVFQHPFESMHRRGPMDGIGPGRFVYLPVTVLWPDGTSLALTEVNLFRYPGLNLCRPSADAPRLTALMAREPTATDDASKRWRRVTARADRLVRCEGTRTFPWRVFMVADTPAGLYDGDLPEALAEPQVPGDFAWIRPGKVAWEWWNNRGLTDVPFAPGVNTATYRAYIDFAADFRLDYVILDEGWAEGLDITRAVPAMDLPALFAYARKRGVRLILWSSWQQLDGRQEAVFAHYAAMGAAGFKIDFIDRDDALIADFLETTARIAAKYRLVLDIHGIHKPTGLSRTWPNVLSYEGVYGLEQVKWCSADCNDIVNTVRIAFTRLLAGPADYTPGAMRNVPRSAFRADNAHPMSMGTRARQAALFMLYDTGIQMLADSPSAYRREPDYTRLLAEVPLLWDDTVCDPRSEPDSLLLVRRRKGDTFWFAAIVGEEAQTTDIVLPGTPADRYRVTLLRDGPQAPAVGTDYVIEQRTLSGGGRLFVPVAAGGGFLAKAEPQSAATAP